MKTSDEFKSFYANHLAGLLDELDKDRKKRLSKITRNFLYYFLIAIGIIGIGLLINQMVYGSFVDGMEDNVPLIISVIIAIIGVFIVFGINSKERSKFVAEFKNKVIRNIVKFINENLEYYPEDYIKSDDFNRSEIFKQYPDKYYGDDKVAGKVDKTDIVFSEIHAKYKTTSNDEDNKEKWVKLFDGLFFKADFHKDFNGKYFVMPDFAEKTFGSIGKFFQKLNRGRGQLIHLEDPEFEKAFAVYGTDQIEARYILSSSMMKRILDFKNKSNKNIMMSFVNSSVYIAIPYKKQLFEPNFYSSVVDEKKTLSFFEDFNLAVSIVEELNLNTRIWSKS